MYERKNKNLLHNVTHATSSGSRNIDIVPRVGHIKSLTSSIKYIYEIFIHLIFLSYIFFYILVALTACADQTRNINGAVKFAKIYTSVGITNQSSFQSTGKFVCDAPGLYYISSHIRTNVQAFAFTLMKNNEVMAPSATTIWPGNPSYSTGVITAAVEAKRNDELYINIAGSLCVQGYYSCLTVIKVK